MGEEISKLGKILAKISEGLWSSIITNTLWTQSQGMTTEHQWKTKKKKKNEGLIHSSIRIQNKEYRCRTIWSNIKHKTPIIIIWTEKWEVDRQKSKREDSKIYFYQFLAKFNGGILVASLLSLATSTEHTNPPKLGLLLHFMIHNQTLHLFCC